MIEPCLIPVLEELKTHDTEFVRSSSGCIRHATELDGHNYPCCPLAFLLKKRGLSVTNWSWQTFESQLNLTPSARKSFVQESDAGFRGGELRDAIVAACISETPVSFLSEAQEEVP